MDYWLPDAPSSTDQMCVAQGTMPTAAQDGRLSLEATSALFVSIIFLILTVLRMLTTKIQQIQQNFELILIIICMWIRGDVINQGIRPLKEK